MQLTPLDWLIVGLYVVFAVSVGLFFTRRASRGMEEYFLSGRSLPWWIAGTSMVATTFAADTPLVITGWVREHGIWKNWLWWCYAVGGMMTVFLFARYWRRGRVLTTAGLAELRYGGSGARVLRGFLGVYHAGITNTIVLCWVMLAAAKIMDVLFGVEKGWALAIACGLSLSYSLLAGFWGVVLTDLVQFTMAMAGAICLAFLSWESIGGSAGLMEAAGSAPFTAETLSMLPTPGPGGWFDASFWTVPVATVAVYMGVAWWAVESIDGGGPVVQRVSASRDEREGTLAVLWFNVAHIALRPWPWILVALASLIVLPPRTVHAPFEGSVTAIESAEIELTPTDGGAAVRLPLAENEVEAQDWRAQPHFDVGDSFAEGEVVARTDSERAYVAMMTRFLPAGLLGLVVASLLAAFMSTIDTHVNLASSFFVSDVYRRFLAKDRGERHYVGAARVASVVVLLLAALLANQADSISDLFQFFLAFLGGVGPIYILRWLWWRVRASTEITAMLASSLVTIAITKFFDTGWPETPWTPEGVISAEGRLLIVALCSLAAALGSMLVTATPKPADLVEFYRIVRPVGAWGPVRALCPEVTPAKEGVYILSGLFGSLALTYGLLFGIGFTLLDRPGALVGFVISALGAGTVAWTLPRLLHR